MTLTTVANHAKGHDPAVAELVAARDVSGDSARELLAADGLTDDELDQVAAALVGPLALAPERSRPE